MRTIALLTLLAAPSFAQTSASTQKEAIERSANQCGRLDSRAGRLRRNLSGLNDRTRRGDPTLRLDVHRCVDDARRLAEDVREALAALKQLLASAVPDADSVEASKNLHRQADGLRAAANFLYNEIRWDSHDLQRAGFGLEAFKIEENARTSFDVSREILSAGAELRGKVQPPAP
jgi:hypothetical protein